MDSSSSPGGGNTDTNMSSATIGETFYSPFGTVSMNPSEEELRLLAGNNRPLAGSDGSFAPNEVEYMSDEAGIYVIVVFVLYAVAMALLIYRYLSTISNTCELSGTELKMYSNRDGSHEIIYKSQGMDEKTGLIPRPGNVTDESSVKMSHLEDEEDFDAVYRADEAAETLV